MATLASRRLWSITPTRNKEKRHGALAELGPAWIGALATLLVALTGVGFFAVDCPDQ
jgi:hypothetical protein